MSNTNSNKTDEQILAEHAAERTQCTVYTRVMGYHRPVETFNAGKQGEFEERQHFVEPGCSCKG
jgi:anaerobic ribonucleoside-triphosphate reductase